MRQLLAILKRLLSQPGEKVRLLKYWFLVFSFMLVVPNIGFILEVLFNQPILTIAERIELVSSLYGNSLRFLFEPVTFSVVLLSILLALNFQLIRFVRRHKQATGGRLRSTLTMFVSGHCVACGGSLLAPLTSLFTGSTSYFSSERYLMTQLVTIGLNVAAMSIALWSMKRAAPAVQFALRTKTADSGDFNTII